MKADLVNATDVKVGMYISGIDGWWKVTGIRNLGIMGGGVAVSWNEGPTEKRYERYYARGAMVAVWMDEDEQRERLEG